METHGSLAPRVIPWSPRFPLDAIFAALGAVRKHVLVRITGGCADMTPEDAQGVLELFQAAFSGFEGAILIGGTRMIYGKDPDSVLFGITEVGPAIRRDNPDSFVLGVVPRCDDFGYDTEVPILTVKQDESITETQNKRDQGLTTIVHPDQDLVVAAITPLTKDEIWDDEVEFCRYVTKTLVDNGRWQSLLVAYNGGGTTEREIRATAGRGWPVLIVQGSGRKCDELAADAGFLQKYPNVMVCQRDALSMRGALERLDVVPRTAAGRHLRIVS
jgi:hypothetical protein